jgi:hypothetical protein
MRRKIYCSDIDESTAPSLLEKELEDEAKNNYLSIKY